jgi:hypothetical protein
MLSVDTTVEWPESEYNNNYSNVLLQIKGAVNTPTFQNSEIIN